MGAIKDKKLRDAAPTSTDDAAETASELSNNGVQGNSEFEPQVITSSPAMPETRTQESLTVEVVGADS